MDNRSDVREFLVSRRAKVSPEQVGLHAGTNRRVPGLRRAEAAMLANVSVEYYSRLERGDLTGASEPVLDAIADALQLDDGERAHLHDLARAASASPARTRRRASRAPAVRPSLQTALDAITAAPAFARNGRMDLLATNRLGRALYAPAYEDPTRPANLARFNFLDPERAQRFYRNWSLSADICVQILRTEAGRDPYDKGLTDLIGELSTRSAEFRTRWAKHDVRLHASGVKQFHHPVVGDLDLAYEEMELMADPGSRLLIYSAAPGSPSGDALAMLASWAATHDADEQAARPAAARTTQ
jgi:transcriptional regulator with XRE-family HTH domain